MNGFWEGFEKRAASIDFIRKGVAGGLSSRAKTHLLEKGRIPKGAENLFTRGKSPGEIPKGRYLGFPASERAALRGEVSEMSKKLPKKPV